MTDMKKLLFTILLLLTSSISFAQDEHMKFMGIPIDGPLESFVQKLKTKGYSHIETRDGIAILRGEFATQKNCQIHVTTSGGRDKVNIVTVIFPKRQTWGDIMDHYTTYKSLLTEKYGQPECVEEFSEREPTSDFLKFHALLLGCCTYASEFRCDNGSIQLSMTKMNYNSASVYIKYIDTANTEELRKKVLEDL